MRRERLWATREGLLEDRATGGQRVERRCEGVPITVAAEVVGARGVERDEEDVTRRRPAEPAALLQPRRRSERDEGDDDDDAPAQPRVQRLSRVSVEDERGPPAQYSVPVGKPPSWPACQVLAVAFVTADPPPTVAYLAVALLFTPPLTDAYLPLAVFLYPALTDAK